MVDRTGPVPKSDDGLQDKIRALASGTDTEVTQVDRALARLSKKHGQEVYSRFIHLISHLALEPEEAHVHWRAIREHIREMSAQLRRPVDYRVGLADYFVHSDPKIRNPKVMDIRLYWQTEDGNLRDGLTGLYNFRYLVDILPKEVSKARRMGNSLGVVFLDVDYFKLFNDRQGHQAGNRVLLKVADAIRASIREMDTPCRFGGEEFTVLLPATDKRGSLVVAERIVRAVEKLMIPSPSPLGVLTVSAGAATFPVDAVNQDGLLKAADAAMYQAKAEGKNRARAHTLERRAYPRRTLTFDGLCAAGSRGDLPVAGHDLSHGGLYFFAPQPLPEGHPLDLHLKFPFEDRISRVSCRAQVVRCGPADGDSFGVGAAITNIEPRDRLSFYEATTRDTRN